MRVTESPAQLLADPLSVSLSVAPGAETALPHPQDTVALVQCVLAAVRTHLDMQVAFVSRFHGDRMEFRHVAGDPTQLGIRTGDVVEMSRQLCDRILRTRAGVELHDVRLGAPEYFEGRDHDRLRAYLGVPILRADGSLFGSLCGLSTEPRPRFLERDGAFLRALADVIAMALEKEDERLVEQQQRRADVHRLLSNGELSIVFQPIHSLTTGDVVGVEALSRFADGTGPDVWFDRANDTDLGAALELHAVRAALAYHDEIPRHLYLSVNISPPVAESAELDRVLGDVPAGRLVVELTEHRRVHDYEALAVAVSRLQEQGCRVAVDDAGAGYSSFRHVVELSPDMVKVDRSLVSGLDRHAARRAFLAGLAATAGEIGVTLVAEGVETADEQHALVEAGLAYGQGFHLTRPAPLDTLFPRPTP